MKVLAPCLKCWTLAGTWPETERALHRLARSLRQAGSPFAREPVRREFASGDRQ